MSHEVFRYGDRITLLPIIHGSGDMALEVRRVLLDHHFDCVAVPLPPSFQEDVEQAIQWLPRPSIVTQASRPRFQTEWQPDADDDDDEDEDERILSYVPVDPCQAVIMALRLAMGEHIDRHFIDVETARYEPASAVLPDPYALKKVPLPRFASALLPTIERPREPQHQRRIAHMAARLRRLQGRYDSILFVCDVLDWPWIREALQDGTDQLAEDDAVPATEIYAADPKTQLFLFGELPFITGLYERARAELEDDANLSIDGVKELLLAARNAYRREWKGRGRPLNAHHLSQCLKYIRNLSLIDNRMTPDLYTMVVAAQQIAGDRFALHVAEVASRYPYAPPEELEMLRIGVDRIALPDGELSESVSRLPGTAMQWRTCHLQPRPQQADVARWQMQWDPYAQCSYPPEDELIENFRAHVFARARAIQGADLARTEKFSTSIKDGIDIRDTLRHWYEHQIYVKVLPPNRGRLDCAVMLFDSPADPRDYAWRTTWYAEHKEESTLAFFGTDYRSQLVGPGIGMAMYGGALFLYPPRQISDVWRDQRLDFTETLEERLLAAACLHSRGPHIALLSALPPGAGWRRLAKRFHKRWLHIPLSQFSESTLQKLRTVHVLNGTQVRSYAAHFIRRA